MKYSLLTMILPIVFLSSCDMAHKINQSTAAIEENTRTIDRSTEAINRNLEQLDKALQSGS